MENAKDYSYMVNRLQQYILKVEIFLLNTADHNDLVYNKRREWEAGLHGGAVPIGGGRPTGMQGCFEWEQKIFIYSLTK